VLAAIKLSIRGNSYVVDRADGHDEGSFKLIETASPKSMDVTSVGGAEVPAIYGISGDTFKACYGNKDSGRPTEFSASEDSKRALIVYKRKGQ
jgi:uncharacterized protein (TIGR03067 family)